MKTLIFCLLLINFQHLQCQSLTWHQGAVVLQSDRVITGRISIEPLYHLILVESEKIRNVYPAHNIKSLYFYDEAYNINRRFISLKNQDMVHREHQLYEVILQGEVTFLRQQKTKKNQPSDAMDFTYYIQHRGDMVPLRKFRRKIYPDLLEKAGGSLDHFIAANNIRAINDKNSIRIIEFYNRFVSSDDAIAKY